MSKTFLLLFLLGAVTPLALVAAQAVSAETMNNLQTAFRGETNAHTRYQAFAAKADEEGYAGVASLFRAAARSEEIHAANHSAAIKAFGGVPDPKPESPEVKSTRENLEAAIKGETYERDEMYPAFIRQAESEANSQALQTLRFARAAEVEHAKLYRQALRNLEELKSAQVFYVCPVCGFTASNPDFQRCPTCATPKENFEQVS
jgi:rubrerythrin